MRKHGGIALFLFTLSLMSALSVLYWSNVKERLAATGGLAAGAGPVFCSPADTPCLALTFDLDSRSDDVSGLLTALEKNQTKATFFITGNWLEAHAQDAKDMIAAGHELGNHTQSHPDMTSLNEKDQTHELWTLHEEIYRLTGTSMQLFRPPYGSYDNSVIQNARKNGYITVNWNVDSQDWKDYSVNEITDTICQNENLQNGSIILLHGGTRFTCEALDPVISRLKEDGYRFSTVSQLINGQ